MSMIRSNESQLGRLSTADWFSEAETTKGLIAPPETLLRASYRVMYPIRLPGGTRPPAALETLVLGEFVARRLVRQ